MIFAFIFFVYFHHSYNIFQQPFHKFHHNFQLKICMTSNAIGKHLSISWTTTILSFWTLCTCQIPIPVCAYGFVSSSKEYISRILRWTGANFRHPALSPVSTLKNALRKLKNQLIVYIIHIRYSYRCNAKKWWYLPILSESATKIIPNPFCSKKRSEAVREEWFKLIHQLRLNSDRFTEYKIRRSRHSCITTMASSWTMISLNCQCVLL